MLSRFVLGLARFAVMIAKTKGGLADEGTYEKAPSARTLQVSAGPTRGGGGGGATVRF